MHQRIRACIEDGGGNNFNFQFVIFNFICLFTFLECTIDIMSLFSFFSACTIIIIFTIIIRLSWAYSNWSLLSLGTSLHSHAPSSATMQARSFSQTSRHDE